MNHGDQRAARSLRRFAPPVLAVSLTVIRSRDDHDLDLTQIFELAATFANQCFGGRNAMYAAFDRHGSIRRALDVTKSWLSLTD